MSLKSFFDYLEIEKKYSLYIPLISLRSLFENPRPFKPILLIPLYTNGEPAASMYGGTSWTAKPEAPTNACSPI